MMIVPTQSSTHLLIYSFTHLLVYIRYEQSSSWRETADIELALCNTERKSYK